MSVSNNFKIQIMSDEINEEQGGALLTPLASAHTQISNSSSFFRVQVKTSALLTQDISKDTPEITGLANTKAVTTVEEKKFKTVTHVIFDLDGTLLDTETINNQIISDIAHQYDTEYTLDIQSRVMGRIASEASITAVKLMNIPMTAEEFDERVQALNMELMTQVNLMPGAESLIRHFSKKGVPIAVATSASNTNYQIKSTNYKELFSHFHHIVTGGSDPEVIIGKPAPDIYLVCASRFPDNPKPSECLAFEDSPNGVRSAVNAGMQVVMVPDPCTAPELCADATLVLKSLEEFKPELFGLPEFDKEK